MKAISKVLRAAVLHAPLPRGHLHDLQHILAESGAYQRVLFPQSIVSGAYFSGFTLCIAPNGCKLVHKCIAIVVATIL